MLEISRHRHRDQPGIKQKNLGCFKTFERLEFLMKNCFVHQSLYYVNKNVCEIIPKLIQAVPF